MQDSIYKLANILMTYFKILAYVLIALWYDV